MSSPTRTSDIGNVIAAVPALLGFEPRESVVVLAIHAGRVAAVVRVDAADCAVPEAVAPLARSVGRNVDRARAGRVVVVGFVPPAGTGPRRVQQFADALRDQGRPVDSWIAADGRYFGVDCSRPTCCPEDGTPIPAPGIDARDLAAADCRHRPGRTVVADGGAARRKRARRAGQRWWDRRDDDPAAWRLASLGWWHDAVEGRGITDATAGKVAAAMRDTRMRDAAIISLVPQSAGVACDVAAGRGDGGVPGAFARLIGEGGQQDRPSAATISGTWRACGALLAVATPPQHAPLVTICALAMWWDGDPQRADALLDDVLAAEPGYRLAALLKCVIATGAQPRWQRDEQAS